MRSHPDKVHGSKLRKPTTRGKGESGDDYWRVPNPGSRQQNCVPAPQYADRVFDFCGIGVDQQKYQKIDGQNCEDFGNRMLHKQKLYKDPSLTNSALRSTPGYRQLDLSSGRAVDSESNSLHKPKRRH